MKTPECDSAALPRPCPAAACRTAPTQAGSIRPARRSLRESILSLGALQAAEYLIPLLAVPYLLRVIGAEAYGHIAFVQALSMYFFVATEFGFNLSATRLASILRDDVEALSALFWEVQAIKAGLFVLAATLLGALALAVDSLAAIWPLVLLGLLPAAGSLLYPLWLLQGLERMREAAVIMIGVRVGLLAALFLFVRERADLVLAAALQMGATPIAGIVSWLVLARTGRLRWVRPSFARCRERLADGRPAFFATAASSLYRSTNAVVLGLLAGPVAVTHYSVAEKIVKSVQELGRPLVQASYPRVSALAAQARAAALPLLRKLLLASAALGLCAALGLAAMAEPIVVLLGGEALRPAADVLRLLALTPLVGGLNAVLGIQTMMAFGYGRAFARCVAGAGIFNLAAIVPLAVVFGARGAALSYFLSEFVLLVTMAVFLHRQGVRYLARAGAPAAAEPGDGDRASRGAHAAPPILHRAPTPVCLVTVTYGKRWHLLRAALHSARSGGIARAVVVDNGAQQDIDGLVRAEFGAFAEVLRMGRNTGSAGGFKAGIEHALALGADYLLLLDDDNRLEADCLAQLRAAHAALSASVPLAALAVLAYRPERQAGVAARVPASGMDAQRSAFFGFHLLDVPFKLFRRTSPGRRWIARRAPAPLVTVAVAPYSGLFFHRAVPETHGLPDDRFLLYADDTEFSYRLTRAGGRIVLVTAARLADMEASWAVNPRFGSTFDALLLGDGDFRAFYSMRNHAYFERWSRGGSGLLRAVNRGVYLAALRLRAAMVRRSARFRLLMRALREGEAGRLGEDPEFPL